MYPSNSKSPLAGALSESEDAVIPANLRGQSGSVIAKAQTAAITGDLYTNLCAGLTASRSLDERGRDSGLVYTDFHFCSNPATQHIMPIAKSARKPNAALMKPVQPDDTLAKIVGSTPLPRTEVTKKIWDYIKKNKLQDAKKKTLINADDALKAVFGGRKQVTMFEMTKHVSGHVK